MADLALNISDESNAIHASPDGREDGPRTYQVTCDALEIRGWSSAKGDAIELTANVAATLLQLSQVKEVK